MESPFREYKGKDEFDYILRGKLPYVLKPGTEDQQGYALEEIVKEIEEYLTDEDFLQQNFPEVGLGRVYVELENEDPTINILFGISLMEQKEPINLQDLKNDVEGFMNDMDSNIEGSSQAGFSATGDDGTINVPPCTVYLRRDESQPTVVEVLKQPGVKKECNEIDYDKELVNKGTLKFKNYIKRETKTVSLNDDGVVEVFKENKWINSQPFTKIGVNNICKSIIKEGYILKETEVTTSNGETVDTEKEKEELEQTSKELDDIKTLKQEIEDKVDEILEESKEIFVIKNTKLNKYLMDNTNTDNWTYTKDKNKAKKFNSYEEVYDFIEKESKFGNNGAQYWEEEQLENNLEESVINPTPFPTSEYTEKVLTPLEIQGFDAEKDLTEEQLNWLNTQSIAISDLEEALKQFAEYISVGENIPFISICDYIQEVY